jgi:hypothetical protein
LEVRTLTPNPKPEEDGVQTECPTSEQLISLIVNELGTATADALRLSGSEKYGLELAA